MKSIQSFRPVIDEHSKILILGTIPGVQSLEKKQYYANVRNQFWEIIYTLFEEIPSSNYEDKKLFLLKRKIAIWDVIDSCQREGSLDSKIKDERINDFCTLFKAYPNIKSVFFNGKKAFKIFVNTVGINFTNIKFIIFPSTSPTYTIALDKKIDSWKKLLDVL
jgi:TDG/mug DNA glycosylase family protein